MRYLREDIPHRKNTINAVLAWDLVLNFNSKGPSILISFFNIIVCFFNIIFCFFDIIVCFLGTPAKGDVLLLNSEIDYFFNTDFKEFYSGT